MLLKDNIQRLVNNAYSELGLLIYTYEKHVVRKVRKRSPLRERSGVENVAMTTSQ